MDHDTAIVPVRHKLNVDDYHRMADAGILNEDDGIELIDGDLIDMAPVGQGHAAIVNGSWLAPAGRSCRRKIQYV